MWKTLLLIFILVTLHLHHSYGQQSVATAIDTLWQDADKETLTKPADWYLRHTFTLNKMLNEAFPVDSTGWPSTAVLDSLAKLKEAAAIIPANLPAATPPETAAIPEPVIEVLPLETVYDLQPIKQKARSKDLIFYLLLLAVILLVTLNQVFSNYMERVYRSVWNLNLSKQFFEDYNHGQLMVNVLVMTNIVLVFSTLGYLLLRYFGLLNHFNNIQLLLFVMAVIGVYVFLRNVVLAGIANILPIGDTIHFYIFNLKIVNSVLVTFMLPVLIVMAFAQPWLAQIGLYFMLFLLLLSAAYIVQRGFSIGKEFITFHKFHFFLYLCTFEIAPLLVIYKLLQQYISQV